jgi:hypothetical protein
MSIRRFALGINSRSNQGWHHFYVPFDSSSLEQHGPRCQQHLPDARSSGRGIQLVQEGFRSHRIRHEQHGAHFNPVSVSMVNSESKQAISSAFEATCNGLYTLYNWWNEVEVVSLVRRRSQLAL